MLLYPHKKSVNLSSYLDSSQGNIFYQEAGAGERRSKMLSGRWSQSEDLEESLWQGLKYETTKSNQSKFNLRLLPSLSPDRIQK